MLLLKNDNMYRKRMEGSRQRMAFLGFLVDTVRMCITFDEIQARSILLQMIEHVEVIETCYDLDFTTMRSVARKLE